jgi:LDH2 family malate/lactate/ureidoglycolate dehydrogenase
MTKGETQVAGHRFSVGELEDVAVRVLAGLGTPPDLAALTAGSLAQSNLLGHDSHGIIRLLQYADWISDGQIRVTARPAQARRFGATALIDGNWGFGQPAARMATEVAIELAAANGVGAVAVANCNHVGRLGEYVARVAEVGCIGLAWCNSGPVVAPAGGTRRTFGTNPLAWAAPRAGAIPLVLDFSTAGVAEGKVKVAMAQDERLPAGMIIDRNGRPSTQPQDLYDGGALLPFGGHKGSGLCLMIELVGGLLTGMGTAPMPDYAGGNGTLLIALSIGAFTDLDTFAGDAAAFARRVTESEDGGVEPDVFLPGQVEQQIAAERAVGGVPVPGPTRRDITELAESLGVDLGRFALHQPEPTLESGS